jgi:hypothetical protein
MKRPMHGAPSPTLPAAATTTTNIARTWRLTQPCVRYWATLGEIGGLLLQDNNSLATIFTEFDRDRSGRLSYKGNAQHHQKRHVLYSDS